MSAQFDALAERLREHVMFSLGERGACNAETVALTMDVPVSSARAFLNRKRWSIEVAFMVIEAFDLPLEVRVIDLTNVDDDATLALP